ncbi:MAG: DUF664 domain-containing protein, partial [Nocardia sp.]|nr:DUF664 domain-containing protein [Nocardia sp.]
MKASDMNDTLTQPLSAERADLVAVLDKHRGFLRFTVRDLTDEQAAARPTVSELCLGGLIKHVTAAEKNWAEFSAGRGDSRKKFADMTAEDFQRRADEFRMLPGETLAGLLTEYDEVARRTNDLIQTLP